MFETRHFTGGFHLAALARHAPGQRVLHHVGHLCHIHTQLFRLTIVHQHIYSKPMHHAQEKELKVLILSSVDGLLHTLNMHFVKHSLYMPSVHHGMMRD